MLVLGDTFLKVQALRWIVDEARWVEVPWDNWSAFRDVSNPRRKLPYVLTGVHHFVVVVREFNDTPVNIIPHKYLIEAGGKPGWDNFKGLNEMERTFWSRFMTGRGLPEADCFKLRYLQVRDKNRVRLPAEAINGLRFTLKPPPAAGSLAELLLR